MSMIVQYMYTPLPGSDLAALVESAKVCASLWKRHGVLEVSLWSVVVGEMGNFVFAVRFENFTDYGRAYDALQNDPEFKKWQADSVKAGNAEWVRGNIVKRIAL